ncbi:maleylpyruvate isomerase family mycothiol-dependent enzyme [Actinomycetospora soli]|uniref:maleylpyruvate isomerase family mycothiol-dependent enzyme n=1 Tax=Actinomycetospora soli TaxID=2893887 RepID=UPI001E494DE2|nr:maleylpyruvate isomerase family mycothiol-dependent enzyme [Actinomycetospora soli]MCD2187406.1 maleylpyruvate isomerase family mycothiol-dependent enzyme [Actinomycetospora soli]
MDDEGTWQVVADQRRVMAGVIAGRSADDLDHPSLCSRWRVRDVAAHVALTPRSPGVLRLVGAAVRARGSFDEVNRALAVAHAERLGAGVADELLTLADDRRRPVITTLDNLLFDTLVHVQDVAVPLGVEVVMPLEGARAGADRVWRMGWPFRARRRFRGLRLSATDVAWSRGEGEEVRGGIADLLLLLTGRTATVAPRLHGPGVGTVLAG